jgi:hypothetical protein
MSTFIVCLIAVFILGVLNLTHVITIPPWLILMPIILWAAGVIIDIGKPAAGKGR